MDLRNIKRDKAVMLIETRSCRPLPLAIFLALIFLLAILGAGLTALLPDQYVFNEYSTTSVLKDPYESYTFPASSSGLNYNKILFVRPVSSNEHIGINFDLDFNVTTGNTGKTRIVSGHFTCLPNDECTDLLLLRYDGKNTAVTISVSNTTQADPASKWLQDSLKLVTRYDNMTFERSTIIWRYISIAFVLVVFLMIIIQTCRMKKRITAEQQDVILLMIGVLIYNNPAYVFILFYRGSFWSIIDEILSMFGVSTMMLYPLIVLGGFITTHLTICGFYLPRFIIICTYFISRLVVEVYPAIQSRLNPDTDVYSLTVYQFFNTFSTIVYVVWIIFFIYTIQRCLVVIKQHPKAIKGRYRAVIVWIVFISIVYHIIQFLSGLFTVVQVSHGAWELVRSWLATILAFSMGVFFLPSKQMRMTSTSISGALHPKGKSARVAETATEVEDHEVQEEETTQQQKSADEEYDVDMESGFTGDVSSDRAW